MVDLLGMFRRRPAKRGKAAFARSRGDITALGDSFGDLLTHPVRDAPPIAREASMTDLDLPRAPASAELPRELPRERPRELPRSEPPRPRPARPAKPAKGNGSGGPQLLRRPAYLAVHSVEKSFGSPHVVCGASIHARRRTAVKIWPRTGPRARPHFSP